MNTPGIQPGPRPDLEPHENSYLGRYNPFLIIQKAPKVGRQSSTAAVGEEALKYLILLDTLEGFLKCSLYHPSILTKPLYSHGVEPCLTTTRIIKGVSG